MASTADDPRTSSALDAALDIFRVRHLAMLRQAACEGSQE